VTKGVKTVPLPVALQCTVTPMIEPPAGLFMDAEIAHAGSIPARFYTDAEVFRVERELPPSRLESACR